VTRQPGLMKIKI